MKEEEATDEHKNVEEDGDDDQRHVATQRFFGRDGDLLAHDRAHRTAHEGVVHDRYDHRAAFDRAGDDVRRPDAPESLVNAMAEYQAMMDAIRDGLVNKARAECPEDPEEP